MNRTGTILLLMIAFACNKIYAGNPNSVKQFINHSDWNFVENKGQLTNSDAKYYGYQGGVYLYCKPGMISFVFTKIEKENDEQISEATAKAQDISEPNTRQQRSSLSALRSSISTSRADLILLNSNPFAEILASDQQEYYENFYITGNADSGITNVHTYKTITYKSIYPNIDLLLHSREEGMKYEFVVYPGGKVRDIQIQWNGLENMKMAKNGGIEYAMGLGKMEESKPVSFQGGNLVESDFIKHSNVIGFKVNRCDKEKVLVIDPTLIWGTYFGGSGDDVSYGMAIDNPGNVFIAGATTSLSNISSSGAYQTTGTNTYQTVFIAKFSSSGNRIWSTYYGGSAYNASFGIAVDVSGNIVITGETTSASGIASTGAYQTSFGGEKDAFIAQFSNSGIRNWSTYFGGSGQDDGLAITTDTYGNIFITGTSNGPSVLATSGTYQTKNGGNDTYIAKFSAIGNLVWCTYFGSDGTVGLGINIDPSGNVLITGNTSDKNNIASSGAFQTNFGGGWDMIIAKFSPTGNRIWSTYFGGTGDEYGYSIVSDAFGNIYIAGYSSSSSGISTPGSYQPNFGGSIDAVLAKFSSSGNRIWSTYIGDSSANIGFGISIISNGDLLIGGYTASAKGIATPGAYQFNNAGNSDAFIADFSPSGDIHWSTYYGGTGFDVATGVGTDKFGNVYLSGYTGSTSNIAFHTPYQSSFGGGGQDAFIAKFNDLGNNDAGISSIQNPKDSSCPGFQESIVKLENFGSIELDSVKIEVSINGKIQPPYSWTGKLQTDSTAIVNLGNIIFSSGTDTIKSWTSNPNSVQDSFPGNDTAISIINTYTIPIANAGPDTILCYNETYTMQGSGGITYVWHPATYLSSSTNPNAIAILPNTEQYMLVVTNAHGCQDSSPVLLKVRPKLKVKAIALNNPVCYGKNVILYAIGTGGDSLRYQYQWVDDGMIGDTITEKGLKSGWHKVILSDNCSPASAMDSIYVTVIPPAKADFTWGQAQKIKVNQKISFLNQSTNASSYLWTFGTKDSSKIVSPVYIYTDSGDYRIMLIAYGLNDCPNDTAYAVIQIISNQVTIYIPDAFTPNGDGTNDFFDISGTGIKSYSYDIYNRWGEHIFHASADQVPPPGGQGNASWDGTFKNQPVMEGVYIYQLDVTDVEGQHHYLSGNITLMR